MKWEYRDHVYFEPVGPYIVFGLLKFLKDNNDIFKDVSTIPSNKVTTLVDSLENENPELALVDSARESSEVEESYFGSYRIVSNETSLISNILEIPQEVDRGGVAYVALGEGKKPMSIFKDKYCEELSIPHFFPTGKYWSKVQWDIPLLPVNDC